MACSDIRTCTTCNMYSLWYDNMAMYCLCFSKLLGIVAKVLNSIRMTYRCTYIINGWLPGDSGPDSSHVARLDDNN